MKRLHRGGDHPEMQKTENMKRLRRGDHPEMQKKTVDAGASGGGEEGITCGGCGTPVSMELDDDDHHVHMDLQELPEGCIANVVSLTTPQDAYRFSAVSRSFMSSADSDAVWDKFLPPDIPSILSHSSSSEKKLYLTLCENPVLVDDGKMSFTLDKWSGKKCYMISPKDLMIIWGDNPEYWKWISLANSRQVILVFHSQISEAFSRLQMCTPQAKDRLSRDVTHILGCIRALPSDKMSESSIPKWGQLDEFLVQRFGSEAG